MRPKIKKRPIDRTALRFLVHPGSFFQLRDILPCFFLFLYIFHGSSFERRHSFLRVGYRDVRLATFAARTHEVDHPVLV